MKKLTNLILIGGILLCSWSCNLDYFERAEIGDIVFDPSIAIPVGEITYTVEELFQELNDAGAEVGSTPDNVVTLTYEQQLQSQTATSFLAVQDQSFGGTLSGGSNVTNPATQTTVSVSNTFEFQLSQRNSEEYDSIYFQDGRLNVQLQSEFSSPVDYTLTFISLEDNGTPFVLAGRLTASNPNLDVNQSLAGFRGFFHLDRNGNVASDRFLVSLAYDVIVSPGSSITATEGIDLNVAITNTAFDAVYGDVGTKDLTVSFDVANLDFFSQFSSGTLRFANPSVDIIFQNSFGFPLGVTFPEFAAITDNGTIIPLTGTVNDNVNIVTGPSLAQQGDIQVSNVIIDRNNSNIDQLLSAQPRKIVVDVNTVSNPPSGTDQYNFVEESSILDVSTRIEIPLELNLNNLGAERTVNFTNGDNLTDATKLLFRIVAENELPMGGNIELQFKDSNGDVVFTVDEQQGFSAAGVGPDGRTTEVTTTVSSIQMQDADIRAIENATTISVLVNLSTTNASSNDAVKFFNDYELKFKLAVQADVSLNSNGE